MQLQLLIPQYDETDEMVAPMLDSIKIQQGIDFNQIEVLIGNDGSDTKLSSDFLDSYPYSIQYLQLDHSGCGGARQRLFDKATADYVIFCDADDMFLISTALFTLFEYMKKQPDAIICDFIEELKNEINNTSKFIPYHKDHVLVHGKVYRRQYLIDNDIRWSEDREYHEDGAYNVLAIHLTDNKVYCQTPLYLWKWRSDSICRKDKLYPMKTYIRFIYSNSYLVNDFLKRDKLLFAQYYLTKLIYDTYYMLNTPIWLDPMHSQYRYEVEKCMQKYYQTRKKLFNSTDPILRCQIIAHSKLHALRQGTLLEKFTFEQWINHIENLK